MASGGNAAAEFLDRDLREKTLVTFAENTTAHGISRLTQGSPLRRLIWCLIIVGASIGFSLHLSQLTQRYLSYPVSTEFSSEGDDFEFPSITLCPTNFITDSSPDLISNYTLPKHSRGLNNVIFDIPRVYYMLELDNWNISVPTQAYSSYDDGKLALKQLAYRQMLFQLPYETVIYCRYKSEECNFSNFTVYKDENRFLCMTFNPQNRTLVGSGEGNGLYLLLFNFGKTFLTEEGQIDNVPGFRVTLHNPGDKPDFSSGFTAPFGYKTSAQVSMQTAVKVNRDSSPCDDSLPNATYIVDYSRPGDFENQTYFGSTQDCVTNLMQEEFRNSCGCLGTHLPLPVDMFNSTDVCHRLPEEVFFRDINIQTNSFNLVEYTKLDGNGNKIQLTKYLLDNWNVYNRTAQLAKCYHTVRHRQESQGVASKQCRVRCSNTRYDVTTSLASWPKDASLAAAAVQGYVTDVLARISGSNLSDSRLKNLKTNPSTYIPNYFNVLDLYAKSTTATVSSESLAYELRNLFSDLGGILGLWVGVSVITLFELLELLLQLSYLSLERLRAAARTQSMKQPDSVTPAAATGTQSMQQKPPAAAEKLDEEDL